MFGRREFWGFVVSCAREGMAVVIGCSPFWDAVVMVPPPLGGFTVVL